MGGVCGMNLHQVIYSYSMVSAPRMVKVSSVFSHQAQLSLCFSGITALLALGILENLQEQGKVKPIIQMEHNSVEYLHTLIESFR